MEETVSQPTGCIIGEIEQFLQEAIQAMPPDEGKGFGRPRILPSMCLWAGLLVCLLRGFTSQLSLWRLLTDKGFWFYPRFPVSDQAVYKRLEQEGTAPLERLFSHIRTVLCERLSPYAFPDLAPFATEVVALDETTLDSIAHALPSLRSTPQKDTKLLAGKMAGLFDIRRQQWRHLLYIENPAQKEPVAARATLSGLPHNSLVLVDLGYFGFAFFDWLVDQGYHFVSRLRNKTSYTVLHTFYQDQDQDTFDGIIFLGAYRADQAAHAVRLVQFRQQAALFRYITSVLDPAQLPLADIARVYARRWDIEMAFRLVKQHLKLHLLWSSKTTVVLQQVWAVLIIAQVLHALQREIAHRAGVDPFDVSLALLVEYLPRFAYAGEDPLQTFVERGRQLGFIRPSRRTRILAPNIPPDHISPLPDDLLLLRPPRYAFRNCGPRAKHT
jgi:hypothetical protein